MNHASLFSGIGGFDLAAEWMGWNNVLHVERDPFCQRVLKHHFPNALSFDDVKTFDGRPFRGRVDILTGGFPCQPYSTAGKRLGKDDERHLWPEMRRIISEIAPTYVVGENVRGLTNWNGGLVFEEVCVDLEALGYEVWTGIIPAAGVGAPHRRDRVWFVAHANFDGAMRRTGEDASACDSEGIPQRDEVQFAYESGELRNAVKNSVCGGRVHGELDQEGTDLWQQRDFSAGGANGFYLQKGNATYAECDGLEHSTKRGGIAGGKGEARERVAGHTTAACWSGFPTQSPVCGGDDGIPRQLDGITFPKWRNESIKAYGNAIVPQVAYQIFRAIEQTR